MGDVFKREDIKAGYLLKVKDRKQEGREFNMTVIPCRGIEAPPLLAVLLGTEFSGREDGELACCGGGEFWPMDAFDEELTANSGRFRVLAVYGETAPRFLLDNDIRERRLLWEWGAEPVGTKKAMLSQPMAGKSEEEIAATREKAMKALEAKGYTVINTLFTDEWYAPEAMQKRGVEQIPLCYLAKSLENMSKCHAAYFCKGWENYRGCRIEHQAAKDYGLEILYEEDPA